MEGESYYLSRCNHRRFTAFLPNDRTIEPRAHANPPRVTTTKKTPGGDTRLNRQLAVLYCQRLLWLSTRVIEKIVGLFALSADWTGFIRLSRTDSLYLNRAPDKIALSAPDRGMWIQPRPGKNLFEQHLGITLRLILRSRGNDFNPDGSLRSIISRESELNFSKEKLLSFSQSLLSFSFFPLPSSCSISADLPSISRIRNVSISIFPNRRGNPFTVTERTTGGQVLSFHGDKKCRRRLVRVVVGPSPRTTGYIRSGSKVTIIEHDIFVPGRQREQPPTTKRNTKSVLEEKTRYVTESGKRQAVKWPLSLETSLNHGYGSPPFLPPSVSNVFQRRKKGAAFLVDHFSLLSFASR